MQESCEEAATCNEVLGRMEFVQQHFARLKCIKVCRWRRSPEVHLIGAIGGRMQREPVIIRDGDEEAHS